MYVVYKHPDTLDIAADTSGLLDSGELVSAATAAMNDYWPCLHAFKCPCSSTRHADLPGDGLWPNV